MLTYQEVHGNSRGCADTYAVCHVRTITMQVENPLENRTEGIAKSTPPRFTEGLSRILPHFTFAGILGEFTSQKKGKHEDWVRSWENGEAAYLAHISWLFLSANCYAIAFTLSKRRYDHL